ncbi:MAG TPA: hypothetical protein VMY38_06290 [Gemmatimonadaceae bacterium]|nr:hypothetical protein [Gemmatimonadaceae bacterium]
MSTPPLQTRWSTRTIVVATLLVTVIGGVIAGCVATQPGAGSAPTGFDVRSDMSPQTLAEGQRVFRFETFNDEKFWTDTARMHEVVQKSVSPNTALSVGLKVDAEAIPAAVAAAIRAGQVDLNSPATTVTLLKLNAVVGLRGTVNTVGGRDTLVRLGVTCALCHSTVDNSFARGIGRRMDGAPNVDLDVGAIIALSPAITAAQKAVYSSWGPGKYDPRYNFDGRSTPLVLPPAYGLASIRNETFTAEGPISYWNAYVAITQMHGQGNFSDPRPGIHVRQSMVFNAHCASCHVGGTGTDNNAGVLHDPSETGMSSAYAMRTANKRYRTTPLRGLWQHPPYFHDGSAATLEAVVAHYNRVRTLRLGTAQQQDLVQYLKSL